VNRQVGWILTEIERQSEKGFSEELRQQLLDEASAHLDAAIQARLEMGVDPDIAAKDAVKEFGSPKEYVDELRKTYQQANRTQVTESVSGWSRAALVTLWIWIPYSMIWIVCGRFTTAVSLMFAGAILGAPIFAYCSFKSRQILVKAIGLSCLSAYLLLNLCVMTSWHNLWAHGGTTVVPGWESASYAHRFQSEANEAAAALEHLQRPIRSADGATLFYALPGITYELDEVNDLQRRRDVALANLHALEDAERRPAFHDLITNLKQTFIVVPFLLIVVGLINAIFGGIGLAVSRFKVVRRQTA